MWGQLFNNAWEEMQPLTDLSPHKELRAIVCRELGVERVDLLGVGDQTRLRPEKRY